ncbi:MAG: histidine phosphatase family protein [Candidatus Falkowbacteria bacterium]|nr:histidine phosphatase family protein [Candidatus Falkowbacteria bacterium]
MKIIFIRHGQTTGDLEDRYGGDYDDHLSANGKKQAKILLLELKDKGIEVIISSPLIRAKETAEIISGLGCPIIIEPGFKERNQYGILSGRIKSEAKKEFPDLVEKLKDRFNTIDGAEPYEDFSKRVQKAFKNLESEGYSCVTVIWHGGPMRVLFRDILDKGELKEIGDCAWVELETNGGQLSMNGFKRIELV